MTRLLSPLLAVVALGASLPAAQAVTIKQAFASELGAVIAGAEPCGLAFNLEAIQKVIEENVTIADLGFTNALGDAIQFRKNVFWPKLSETERFTMCVEIKRNAVAYGFIE